MDANEFVRFSERHKNWGRWGADDEAGTLNFVSPQQIVKACRLVRKGRVFSLAIPFDDAGPQRSNSRRFNPIHTMLRTGQDGVAPGMPPMIQITDDMVTMPLQCATQWDALAHVIFQGNMYNGRPSALVDGQGAHKNSIDKIRDRVIGRGVLLDLPRYRGLPWLEPGYAIGGEELEACASRQGVTVEQGDFLLVRTGNMAMCRQRGGWGDFAGGPRPGLGIGAVPWLHEKQVAAVAADNNGVEVHPTEVAEVRYLALHAACVANMGMLFGEIFDLDALAQDCAEDGVYEFLFIAAPLPVTRAVGSPINPYAVK